MLDGWINNECAADAGMRIVQGKQVRGRNLLQCHFVLHKSHMSCNVVLYAMMNSRLDLCPCYFVSCAFA
jgi:hypothetical protein